MSLPAYTPQEDEGISSSPAPMESMTTGGAAISPPPADERRCTGIDEKGRRCKKPREDDVYCEHHHYADAMGCSKSRVSDGNKRGKKDDAAIPAEPPLLPVKKAPWLALPPESSADSFRFVSMEDDEDRRINLPKTLKKATRASSYGSLISTDHTEVLLLDPFTRAVVRLPPLANFEDGNNHEFIPTEIHGLVFLLSTGLVVCVDGNKVRHFFSSHVDKSGWTMLGKCTPHNCNIIIHKGEFYTVEWNGSLISFDPAAGLAMSDHGFSAVAIPGPDDLLHLVESIIDGVDLLLVHQKREEESSQTLSFRVFKQDKDAHRWVRVKNLDEVAIFVGGSFSACIPTQGLPKLRGNHIYFTVDVPLGDVGYDYGVFDLGTGANDETNIGTSDTRPQTFWIMPSVS